MPPQPASPTIRRYVAEVIDHASGGLTCQHRFRSRVSVEHPTEPIKRRLRQAARESGARLFESADGSITYELSARPEHREHVRGLEQALTRIAAVSRSVQAALDLAL